MSDFRSEMKSLLAAQETSESLLKEIGLLYRTATGRDYSEVFGLPAVLEVIRRSIVKTDAPLRDLLGKPEAQEFVEFAKIYRVSRQMIVTEKIDGTNAQIMITDDGQFLTGSRQRWITPENDNHGFSRWAHDHKDQLMGLGVGRHFGEWWGQGIQRAYGLTEKRFSLFNVQRWCLPGQPKNRIPTADPRVEKYQEWCPECCGLVPVLYEGMFDTAVINDQVERLRRDGSVAVPGFMRPEGIVAWHVQGNFGLKKTLEKDEEHKGQRKEAVDGK